MRHTPLAWLFAGQLSSFVADHAQRARMQALAYTFFKQKLFAE